MFLRFVAAVTLLVSPLAAHSNDKVYSAAEAVALADASKRGKQGVFEMDVKGTGRIGSVVFLNSEADYRSPDALTFRIAPNVRKALERRYGASPETYLRGKHVVVKGTVARQMIVNTKNGRVVDFNRWQHTVKILLESQIVSVR
ncbi:hypothetical protein [Sphingomonas sp. S2-65]|uniref:hypothetical protein n=1 Tax=Sphingomonas sp. S2-65 TaxID=2903960 RepID=UPI001F260235|nr:hypothetical protein [Sphingomonas sp. S2-65]UYY58223.1 hypothetical protein LZ586_16415 [Sphingomonas sp. S2-65]